MPSRDLNELIDSLSQIKTVEDLHATCSAFCEQFGFDRFLYGARLPTSFIKPYFIFISGYPSEWWSRYKSQGYMLVDPLVAHCEKHVTPICWDAIHPQEKESETIRSFLGEAREFGLNSGASFPVHTPQGEFAMFNLCSSRDPSRARSDILASLPFAHMFSAYLHESVRRVANEEAVPLKKVSLSGREKECLLWTAEGKTTWETSQILKVSERTVVFHLQNAAEKLGVYNRQHAVARAVSLGIITPRLG